jgi:hypothetical protein
MRALILPASHLLVDRLVIFGVSGLADIEYQDAVQRQVSDSDGKLEPGLPLFRMKTHRNLGTASLRIFAGAGGTLAWEVK